MNEHLAVDIANRISDRVSLLHPPAVDTLNAALQKMATADLKVEQERALDARMALYSEYGMARVQNDKPFVFGNGVAIIPVHGILVNRLSWGSSWITGYNFIRTQSLLAGEDSDVETIVWDHNSPGGTAAGCEETAEVMFGLRAKKNTLAVIDAMACSASYWLASAAGKVIMTPSGKVGSIGAYRLHVSMKGMLERLGMKVTFVAAGKYKVEGNETEDLSKEAKERWEADVAKTRDKFATTVALYRGITKEAVLSTEADVFDADAGLELSLIDAISSPLDALTVYQDQLRGDAEADDDETLQAQSEQESEMTTTPTTNQPPALTQDDIKAAVQAERTRITAIQTCAEAKDRPKLAAALAAMSDMTVENAKSLLTAAAPETLPPAKETPAVTTATVADQNQANANFLSEQMTQTGNPDLNAGDGGGADQVKAAARKSRIDAAMSSNGFRAPTREQPRN